jgi:transcriptional regulator with XRE-family HTH domain
MGSTPLDAPGADDMARAEASPEAFLLKRRLRRELARARAARGLTQAEAAEALGVSLSTVIRAELGDTGIPPSIIPAYVRIYGIQGRLDELTEMAKDAAQLPWREYRDMVSKEDLEFFGYEASASLVRVYQNEVVPGLLQLPEYTATILATAFSRPPDEIVRHLALRRERQEHAWAGHVQHQFVLSEAVLRRRVGPVEVARRQLEHLIQMVDRGVSIQVLPFTAGASFAVHGTFTLVEFDDAEDEAIVYLEHSAGSRVTKDNPKIIELFSAGFAELQNLASSSTLTGDMVSGVLEAMNGA